MGGTNGRHNRDRTASIIRTIEFCHGPSVAICASLSDDFRTLQGMETIAAWGNILVREYLRPELRGIVAVQFRPDRYKWLQEQEIRQMTKKQRDLAPSPADFSISFQGKPCGIDVPDRRKTSSNMT